MVPRVATFLLFVTIVLSIQIRAGAQSGPLTETTIAQRHDVISEKEHHYIGSVELDDGRGTKLYADDVWLYLDQDRAVASGNVVFRQGSNQIAADRADFNTKTRLGTFYNASGFAMVQPPRQTVRPGQIAPPPIAGQDTIVYFFGDTVEKIGPRKYEIKKGGFTACVQPTPRWNFSASTILLNLDHYTLLKQVVLNVKGVPLFYLPALYYPTKREDRATGFLLPTYGKSTLQGHSFHNEFFWAINRSQDASFVHDWYSKSGQGAGTEYRYNFGGGSDGSFRSYIRDLTSDGSPGSLPPERSYKLSGSATQPLPGRFRATGRVDYFSSIAMNQAFNTNLSDASNSQRSYGGNIVGTHGLYSMNATFDHREYFYNRTSSAVSGGWPRVNVTRNERPIGDTPMYLSAGGEFVHILSDRHDGVQSNDSSLTRGNFAPQVRFPFKKWQWFTVNTTASWHDTYYSRSYDPTIDPATGLPAINPVTGLPFIIDDNLNRRIRGRRTDHRTGLQPHLGYAGQWLRGEVQAHHRTVRDRGTHVGIRRLRANHQARGHRSSGWRRHVGDLRPDQSVLCETSFARRRPARAGARDTDRRVEPAVSHAAARDGFRSWLLEQQQRPGQFQLFAAGPGRTGTADAGAQHHDES